MVYRKLLKVKKAEAFRDFEIYFFGGKSNDPRSVKKAKKFLEKAKGEADKYNLQFCAYFQLSAPQATDWGYRIAKANAGRGGKTRPHPLHH